MVGEEICRSWGPSPPLSKLGLSWTCQTWFSAVQKTKPTSILNIELAEDCAWLAIASRKTTPPPSTPLKDSLFYSKFAVKLLKTDCPSRVTKHWEQWSHQVNCRQLKYEQVLSFEPELGVESSTVEVEAESLKKQALGMQIIHTESPVLHEPIFSISGVSVTLWHLTFPELPRQVPKNGTTTGGGRIFILFFLCLGSLLSD